jgi:hypothetical protein
LKTSEKEIIYLKLFNPNFAEIVPQKDIRMGNFSTGKCARSFLSSMLQLKELIYQPIKLEGAENLTKINSFYGLE